MTRARLIGGVVAATAALALAAFAWSGEPRAEAGTTVEVAPLTVETPVVTPTGSDRDGATSPDPRPSGRPTPVAPPAAPPVPLDGDRTTVAPPPGD